MACYGIAGLCSLLLVALLVLSIIPEETRGKILEAFTGWFTMLVLPACFLCLISAIFYVWMGKVLHLLNEIAANTQRR